MTRSTRFMLLLLISLISLGCRTESGTNVGDQDKLTVCLLPKIKGIPYFTSCHTGAQEAAAEFGDIELIYDGPIDGDPKEQAELIEQWIVDGVDVIRRLVAEKRNEIECL